MGTLVSPEPGFLFFSPELFVFTVGEKTWLPSSLSLDLFLFTHLTVVSREVSVFIYFLCSCQSVTVSQC